jgi:predicted nucleic acid-binding protein
MRVFLDANVILSAAKSDGAIRELLTLLARSGHQCWADTYVIEEARRNIVAKAPDRLPALEGLSPHLKTGSTRRVDPALDAALQQLPATDRPVLAAAILCRCEALVTGDRTHFGALYGRTIQGVSIHSPRSLAEAVLR